MLKPHRQDLFTQGHFSCSPRTKNGRQSSGPRAPYERAIPIRPFRSFHQPTPLYQRELGPTTWPGCDILRPVWRSYSSPDPSYSEPAGTAWRPETVEWPSEHGNTSCRPAVQQHNQAFGDAEIFVNWCSPNALFWYDSRSGLSAARCVRCRDCGLVQAIAIRAASTPRSHVSHQRNLIGPSLGLSTHRCFHTRCSRGVLPNWQEPLSFSLPCSIRAGVSRQAGTRIHGDLLMTYPLGDTDVRAM
ncbi:uncharacterized protein CC84DRAFT_798282 [Paraphaeosphaeria sporulosa]|uniref:Uncharacterized protein n=1 Tax=Paraphaeosphaeria sporulosa TaxID=1460663 RepID=A0A177CCT7_9PLEO|nr:uncharacterized protein CC84DRAFT_798282 [Paraphaeosphaeria sporulosa]OAG04588.1 hypothetical protein CC84DRAFT_798282 [Paraphaeosphaeria sporulosa]